MVRSGRGPSPFPAWRSLLPGADRRILPEAAPARRGGRRIGPAIALLPLLVCCGLLPSAPTLTRRSRWAWAYFSLLAGAALLLPAQVQAQSVNVSNIRELHTKVTKTTVGCNFTFI